MKKIFLIAVMVLLGGMPCFAKNITNLYVVKNQNTNTVVNDLKKNLLDANLKDSALYSVSPEFYYFKVYQSDTNVTIFMNCNKDNAEKYNAIIKSLKYKSYSLTDKDLSKKYTTDLKKFISLNNLEVKGVKVEKNKYNPYNKPLKNKIIRTTKYSNSGINFTSNKVAMKSKIKRYVDGFEIIVTNNTGSNIILKKVSTGDFVGLTEIAKKAAMPTGVDFIPIYGIIAGAKTDLEKNRFSRPFPTDYTIKSGESVRLLGLSKLQVEPIIDFQFEISGEEKTIQLHTYQ